MSEVQNLERLAEAAHALGRAESTQAQWHAIAQLAQAVFGYSLLTSLVYLKEQRLMRRIVSSNEAISPPGGFKATGKGPWSAQVLDQGMPYIGSHEADIRRVFSEAELLIEHGLHSVLNLPIWSEGQVIGSLNLLHHRHAYDAVDPRLISLVCGLCTPVFMRAKVAEQDSAAGIDPAQLDSV